jgi:hypothetical protein
VATGVFGGSFDVEIGHRKIHEKIQCGHKVNFLGLLRVFQQQPIFLLSLTIVHLQYTHCYVCFRFSLFISSFHSSFTTRHEPYVSYKHWKEMCKRLPRLVLPFQKLQFSWSTLFMGIKWWDSKKWDLEKARKKIIKDKGLASRKKLMMNEMNNAGMSEGSSEEEEEEVQ